MTGNKVTDNTASVSSLWTEALKSDGVVDEVEAINIVRALEKRGVKVGDLEEATEIVSEATRAMHEAEFRTHEAEQQRGYHTVGFIGRKILDFFIEILGRMILRNPETSTFNSSEAREQEAAQRLLDNARTNKTSAKKIWRAIEYQLKKLNEAHREQQSKAQPE